jgi:predicted HD phosphohydrolase
MTTRSAQKAPSGWGAPSASESVTAPSSSRSTARTVLRGAGAWDNGAMTTTDTPTTFTRMDESTAEQWAVIGKETMGHQDRVADRVLGMLQSLSELTDGFAVDQLTHSLQTATRAERAGADDEVVVASLCHDIGKAVSVPNHPLIAAEILKSYVRDDTYQMIRAHQDFQGRHYYHHFGGDPDAREQYRGQPWFGLAEQFADEWDQVAFDPGYDTLPLEHFEARVREVFGHPHSL